MNTAKDFEIIKNVVDKYFDFMDEIGSGSYISEAIPYAMLDTSRRGDEHSYWKPIMSTVTTADLNQLELYFGQPLPESFKYFLKQRHFIELSLGGYGIGFFSNLLGELMTGFKKTIEGRYWNLPERNYLPFAHFMDFGVLCFDSNHKLIDSNYPVMMFTHEDGYDEKEFYANSFEEMFIEFNSHLDDWIKNYRQIKQTNSQ
jgi:hypothetical protein